MHQTFASALNFRGELGWGLRGPVDTTMSWGGGGWVEGHMGCLGEVG